MSFFSSPMLFAGTGSAWDLMTWSTGPSDTNNGTWVAEGDTDGDGVLDTSDAFDDEVAASTDTDGDGQPDDWNSFCNESCQLASALTLDDDDDGDGYSDSEEIAAGTDPLDPQDTPRKGSSILKIIPLLLNE